MEYQETKLSKAGLDIQISNSEHLLLRLQISQIHFLT